MPDTPFHLPASNFTGPNVSWHYRLRERGWPPIAGADDDDAAGDSDADEGSAEEAAERSAEKTPKAKAKATAADADDDETVSKADYDAAMRRLAEAERDRRKLARDAEKGKRRQQEDEGEFQKLYDGEKGRRERLETRVKADAANRKVIEIAARLGFRNAAIAVQLVDLNRDDVVDADFDDEGGYSVEVDEAAIERAVKALSKREPYLVRPEKPQGELRDRPESGPVRVGSNGGRSEESPVFGVNRLRRYHERQSAQAEGRPTQ